MSKIVYNREKLLGAVKAVDALQSGRPTTLAYGITCLRSRDEKIDVEGSTNACFVVTRVVAEGDQSFAMPTSKLRQVLQMQSTETVTITVDGSKIQIKGSFTTKDSCLPLADFACDSRLVVDGGNRATVKLKALQDAVRACLAATDDTLSPHYLGVYLDNNNAVGTDGRRMHVKELSDANDELKVLLPKLVAEAVARADGENAEIVYTANSVNVRCGDLMIAHALPAEPYPPYKQLLPRSAAICSVRVSRSAMLESLANASKLIRADDAKKNDIVSAIVKGGKVGIAAAIGEVYSTELEATASVDDNEGACFQAHLATPIFRSLFDGEHVDIEFRGKSDPIVVRSGAPDDRDMALLMPCRS